MIKRIYNKLHDVAETHFLLKFTRYHVSCITFDTVRFKHSHVRICNIHIHTRISCEYKRYISKNLTHNKNIENLENKNTFEY